MGCLFSLRFSANSQYKNIENWRSWKMRFFWVVHFDFFFQKNFFLLHLNENKQPVHMRYHLFLQYRWFLQNLGKDFIQTNMHTTAFNIGWLLSKVQAPWVSELMLLGVWFNCFPKYRNCSWHSHWIILKTKTNVESLSSLKDYSNHIKPSGSILTLTCY